MSTTRLAGLPVRPRSAAVLGLASLAGLLMFLWPLLVRVGPGGGRIDPPFVFAALLPVVIAVVLAELTEGGMDSRMLAMLGVLTAINAVMRGLSAGTGGIELVFFLLILAGRVFGPGFGFALGCTSLFASALLTAGVGPWLPFQMLASAWVGMGAGLLPRRPSGRTEIAMLAAYGVLAAYAYGLVMNLSSWPFTLGIELPGTTDALSFVPGASLWDNLHRFGIYTLLTSTGSWDTGRAITNAVAVAVLGPAVLTTLRRAVRRASVVRQIPPGAHQDVSRRPGFSPAPAVPSTHEGPEDGGAHDGGGRLPVVAHGGLHERRGATRRGTTATDEGGPATH